MSVKMDIWLKVQTFDYELCVYNTEMAILPTYDSEALVYNTDPRSLCYLPIADIIYKLYARATVHNFSCSFFCHEKIYVIYEKK